jgi:hypothetical protein
MKYMVDNALMETELYGLFKQFTKGSVRRGSPPRPLGRPVELIDQDCPTALEPQYPKPSPPLPLQDIDLNLVIFLILKH